MYLFLSLYLAVIIYLSVSPKVCLMNLLFVVCVGVALPWRVWHPLLSGVCTVWTCVLTVSKMLYQLDFVQPIRYSSNCTMVTIATSTSLTHWTYLTRLTVVSVCV